MEERAAKNAFGGLSTRIPFLKSELCGAATPNCESVRSEPRSLEKTAGEGHVFGLRADFRAYFRFRAFWDEIARFNSFNSSRGLQAISVEKPVDGRILYRVTPCDISYIGDLRVARVTGDEAGLLLGGGGVFTCLYNIFLRRDQDFYSHRHVMTHELEHARHHSLWNLAGFPSLALPSATTEYLAMLRTLIDLGEAPQLLAWRNEFINVQPTGAESGGHPAHDKAALGLIGRLTERYGMQRKDVAMGIAWMFREELRREYGQALDSPFQEQFVRMRDAAIAEYNATYYRMFGVHFDDLRDIVSRLSL